MRLFRIVMTWVFGVLFIAAGANHFVITDFCAGIIPPYLPCHRELVYVSGVAEVVLGALLLIPRCRIVDAWGLVALLIAVFPANLHMALNPDAYPTFAPTLLWLRLPFQGVLIAWAYWLTRAPAGGKS